MTLLALWGLFFILVAGTALLACWRAWQWWRATAQQFHAARARRRRDPMILPRIAPELLRAQARMASLKRQGYGVGAALTDTNAGATSPVGAPEAGRWQVLLQQGMRYVVRPAAGLGWANLLLGLLVAAGVVRGLLWEIQRHPPLPPHAGAVAETIIQGFARQSSYRVPDSVEVIRRFYHRELPQRGWRYCGTQATPRCTNLVGVGAEDEIDVYRRPDDRDFAGLSIEIWARRDRDGLTLVTVFETRLRR